MVKTIFLLASLLMLYSCEKNITVTLEKEPGSIVGIVLPANVQATVELYYGQLIETTTTDENGYFMFQDVSPGTYTLRVRADNYGTQEREGIHVLEGEGYDVGTIELSPLPYPVSYISPFNGQKNVSMHLGYGTIVVYFNKEMDSESLKNALQIEPAVNDLEIEIRSRGYTALTANGTFKFNTTYIVSVDTTAKTNTGERLEFPLTSTFTTENFRITSVSFNYDAYYTSSVNFSFNGIIDEDEFLNKLTISPPVFIYTSTYQSYDYNRISLSPIVSWIPDTIHFFIDGTLQEIGGAYLENDTSFTITMPDLQVIETSPYDNQHFVSINSSISIRMNYVIDEGTIPSSMSITPSVGFGIGTAVHSNKSYITLYPDSLIGNTEYKVDISTALKDYYGGNLKEPYSFSFVTE